MLKGQTKVAVVEIEIDHVKFIQDINQLFNLGIYSYNSQCK